MKQVVKIVLLIIIILPSRAGICGESGVMQGMTAEHNKVRARVGVPEMKWSDSLAQYAQQWADHLAGSKGCVMEHRAGSGNNFQKFGENLYWASAIRQSKGRRNVQQITPAIVVFSWAGEVNNYLYATNSCMSGKVCGHYTQMVWKQTQNVGCGQAVCADKSQIWVCNYDPPGNWLGKKPY